MSPKKPNSANRRICKVKFLKSRITVGVKIPGEKHALQQHSVILVSGANVRDLIGINLKAVRGKFDLLGVSNRRRARSLYGVKRD
jgi:small subunit ribosomal protein S12